MSQREGKPASRGPRKFNGNKGRDQNRDQSRDQGRDQGRDSRENRGPRDHREPRERRRGEEETKEAGEERKFVPWLGEARPKRGPIYDFESKTGRRIYIEFLNGRTIEGVLVSSDKFANLVLDDTVEILDEGNTRKLGKVFCCGRVEALGEVA